MRGIGPDFARGRVPIHDRELDIHQDEIAQRNVRMGCRVFFFVPSRFSQKNFSKKAFPPRVILPGRGETHD